MTIKEITNTTDVVTLLQKLKEKTVSVKSWDACQRDYEPTLHTILTDRISRRDTSGNKAARVYIGLEKLLVNRMNEFTFAIPVKRVYNNLENNSKRNEIAKIIEKIYKYARIDSENNKRGKYYYAGCEFATIWYAVPKKNTLYGFECGHKIKCKTYSPMDGVSLYPYFGDDDDLLAMSFEYSKKGHDGTKIYYFETYTDEEHVRWSRKSGGHYTEEFREPIMLNGVNIGKIPGVYMYRKTPIYDNLSVLREEIEYTISRQTDVIAYNAAPIIKVVGNILGKESKGDGRRVYRVENGGDVSYVSWQQASDAVKHQVDTLLKLYFMQSQMPDLSFENMKSLGSIGFDARQMMFSDAHLKINDEKGAWIEALERECNIIKAFVIALRPDLSKEIDNVEIEHVITPYIQNDETEIINRLQKANGGKPIISHLDSIKMAGYTDDPQFTYNEIEEEENKESERRTNSLFNGEMV